MFDEEPDRDPHGECRAEIARLTAELDAARAVPAEVEVAIGLVDAIVEHVRTLDSYDWQSRLDDSRPSDDAKDDARELSHALRDYDRSNGSAFLRAAIARAIAEARQPSTVGGLLATAPVGEIIEWRSSTGRGWWQLRVIVSGNGVECRTCADGWSWCGWRAGQLIAGDMPRPGRLVLAAEADRDPNQRGPLSKGG